LHSTHFFSHNFLSSSSSEKQGSAAYLKGATGKISNRISDKRECQIARENISPSRYGLAEI